MILKKFMEEMEENRKIDERRRQEERKEDKKEIKAMAKEITDGVKKEMMEAIKPWQERTVVVEENTAVIGEEVKRLAEEIRGMKEKEGEEVRRLAGEVTQLKEKEGEEVRRLAGVVTQLKEKLETRPEAMSYAARVEQGSRRPAAAVFTGANSMPLGGGDMEEQEEKKRIREMFGHARKVIGLKPIDRKHVEKVNERLEEVESESEKERQERAKLQAVEDFLKYEMRMKPEDIEKLTIKKIFPPAKDEWNVLYVELETMEMAQFATSFTTYMRRGTVGQDRVEVVHYVPRDLYTRFRAVNKLGNQARIESDKNISFRVTFGTDDFIMQHKPKGRRGWGPPLPLPADLPPVEHHLHLPRGVRSPGEAPGRPARTPEARKRDREAVSPSGDTPPPKKSLGEELADAELVGSPTITPVKAGEGLLASAAVRGRVTSVSSSTPIRPVTRSNKKNTEDK